MKRILGLDLGTTSIGWAVVNEAESKNEKTSIVKLGVRVVPLTTDEISNFDKGKSITTNADRTLKRGARRNLQRYKLRRENLIEVLKTAGWISDDTVLAEQGNDSTFQTLYLRAKAVNEEISLGELARVLLMINKKRGYKSNRKLNAADGQAVDSMDVAKELYDRNLTVGEYVCEQLDGEKYRIPEFYRSDLVEEFDRIWDCQKQFYPDLLSDDLKQELKDKNKKQTWSICKEPFKLVGIKRDTKGKDQVLQNYQWRSKAVREQIGLEELAIVLSEINNNQKNTSGLLGDISDRSKELFFNGKTVGQYLVDIISDNPNASLRHLVFYRQDYLDEFNSIWDKQAEFHPEMTSELKHEIRDIVIFYQRPLKSQKGLVSVCEFEQRKVEAEIDGKKKTKTVGPKVCPKSSPLFQEFRIWQVLNNLKVNGVLLDKAQKEKLAMELSVKEKFSKKDVLKCLYKTDRGLDLNFEGVSGNKTMAALYKAFVQIVEDSGNADSEELLKRSSVEIMAHVEDVFRALNYNTDVLSIDYSQDVSQWENQPVFRLWHLLYSFEGDDSKSGTDKLVQKVAELVNCTEEHAKIIARTTFETDYGNLSSKAIKKILPYLMVGDEYSAACEKAGYRHSVRSLTKEELSDKVYKDRLELIPRNSLRNPVVEKILNQMVNVVNAIADEYGKPDEIRIELARELKKNQKERKAATDAIAEANRENEKRIEFLREKGLANPTRNDILRYRLYQELESNGYKTLYSGTYISLESLLFGKEFDIEHIIPQAKLFDDSIANKTLELRSVNQKKSNLTAYDFVKAEYGDEYLAQYENRVKDLYENGKISKAKCKRLLMSEKDIPEGFINRELKDSQYIAKKSREMLEDLVPFVVPTTGSITARLRQDWQLVNVLQELTRSKYEKMGFSQEDFEQLWTKRNDHRHHAMDALAIAFTKRSFIQYLNNLSARVPTEFDGGELVDLENYCTYDIPREERTMVVRQIEKTQMYRNEKGKLLFLPPMPLDEFRAEARRQLENVLVSNKAKNKVVTRNVNAIKVKGGLQKKTQLTPRGALHNDTVYGCINRYIIKEEKVGGTFNSEKIALVAKAVYREALGQRLAQFGGDPKKAFTGRNSLVNNPVYLDEMHTRCVPESVGLLGMEEMFTVRKSVSPDLKLEKVVDEGVKRVLEARLAEFGGNAQKAFANLDENPIWLNREKGIQIKRVKIKGVNNVVALHDKKDFQGKFVVDANGGKLPGDFVSTNSNHHVAIFEDAQGKYQEHIVSFYDAVEASCNEAPVIDRNYKRDEGWKFLFTMKQNEHFVFPNAETCFDPKEIDLTDVRNYASVSPNLFRVQAISSKDYWFRHHLDTSVDKDKALKDVTWKRITDLKKLEGIVKVRLNYLGRIVQVGEY